MADEHDAHAFLIAQAAQQVENLRLNGDVEGGGGLVGDEQARLAAQGHGDEHALAHAAGELVRVAVEALGGRRDAHLVEGMDGFLTRGGAGESAMALEHLEEVLAHRFDRVERGHGVLEDHGDLGAAHAAALLGAHGKHVLAGKLELVGLDLGVLGQKAHDRLHGDALARAGLTHDGEELAVEDREVHASHGLDEAAVRVERGAQVAHAQQLAARRRRAHGGGLVVLSSHRYPLSPLMTCGSAKTRRTLPSLLNAKMTITMSRPGMNAI